MGELDNTDKLLEDFNDVFSDIVNVTLFDGDKIIREDELTAGQEHSDYMFDGDLLAQERDICKHWTNGNVRFALLGIENQATIDADMPLRIIGYDGAEYRGQLFTIKTEDGSIRRNKNPRYPVVSIVVYFGKQEWKRPLHLLEAVDVPKRLEIVHVKEIMDLFKYALKDDRFSLDNITKSGEEVPNNMASIVDEWIEKGVVQGMEKGKREGAILENIEVSHEFGLSVCEIKSNIMKKFGLDATTADEYLKLAGM